MKFSLSDGAVTILVGVAAGFLLYLFFNDLNAITSRGNETPLGTIFFKKQTATRKSSDSQMWERLRNQSPVYQSDTLRTDEDSEAVVNFDDGLSLDMLQNSMLKLTTRGSSASLDFKEGSITLHGGEKSAPVVLGQNGHTVSLSADAQLVVTKTKDTMSLELSQGTAQVSDDSGKQQTLTPESAMDLADQGGAAVLRAVDLIPRSPEQGSRLLSLEPGKLTVGFVAQVAAKAQLGTSPVEIQISSSADFANPASYPVTAPGVPEKNGVVYRTEIPLDPGAWYWRLASGETRSSPRQMTLSREEALTLIQPADGSDVSFRKKKPPVRFSWTAGEHAAYWDLELAGAGGDFKTPAVRRRTTVSSLSLEGLAAGSWSWRVIPHYAGTMLNQAAPMTGHFTITQRPEMTALAATIPVEGTLVQTQELAAKGLAFTWDPPPEAKGYELTASKTPGGAPALQFQSASPYKIVTPQELGPLTGTGKSFWTLRWFDEEGNASPPGAPRSVQAVDGSLALRLTFPPDGYQVADRFVANTRFSWKSNLSAKTVFQVARTQEFKDLVWEQPVKAETALGGHWESGSYYWRLSSYNANGSVFIQTPARRLEVVAPFAAVQLTQPQPGSVFLLPEHQDTTLTWPAVKDADFYQLTLFASSAAGTNFSRSSYQTSIEPGAGTESVQFSLPLSQFPEGAYVARIQAFAREKPLSTSVIGLYGDSPFAFKRLTFIKLLSPADGGSIDGLTARRQGVSLEWETGNLPPDAKVKLTSLGENTQVADVAVTAVAPLKVARLNAGEYSWTVEGSVEGFDVSARKPNRFTVLEIPKLPAAAALDPADKTVYGPKELRKMKGIEFTWQPVPQAGEYLFELFQDDQSAPASDAQLAVPVLRLHSAQPKASLNNMAILHRGAYFWQVRARTLDSGGEVEQDGLASRSRFVLDLPVLGAPKLPQGQAFYGR